MLFNNNVISCLNFVQRQVDFSSGRTIQLRHLARMELQKKGVISEDNPKELNNKYSNSNEMAFSHEV